MGILFWYILRQYLTTLGLCLMGLTTIYLVIDFFEKLRKFMRYDAEISSMLLYFFFKIPDICFKLAPFAALMASLLAIVGHWDGACATYWPLWVCGTLHEDVYGRGMYRVLRSRLPTSG